MDNNTKVVLSCIPSSEGHKVHIELNGKANEVTIIIANMLDQALVYLTNGNIISKKALAKSLFAYYSMKYLQEECNEDYEEMKTIKQFMSIFGIGED